MGNVNQCRVLVSPDTQFLQLALLLLATATVHLQLASHELMQQPNWPFLDSESAVNFGNQVYKLSFLSFISKKVYKLSRCHSGATGIISTFIGFKFWLQDEGERKTQTRDLQFMRRGPQPIVLPLGVHCQGFIPIIRFEFCSPFLNASVFCSLNYQ